MRYLLFCQLFSITLSHCFAGNEHLAPIEIKSQVEQWIGSQPVEFLENKGQITDMSYNPVPFVLFKAEARGLDMYITEKGLTYVFLEVEEDELEKEHGDSPERDAKHKKNLVKWARVDMDLKGARIRKENIVTEGASDWVKHFYLGHCPEGIRDVHAYKKITIKNVYPDIDWVLYNSNERGFKYDFIVHPGADPEQISLLYRSQKKLHMDEPGNINIQTPYGNLTEKAPECRLEKTNSNVASRFEITGLPSEHETEISFRLDHFDRTQTLIIDPQMVWMTVLGGNNLNSPKDISVDNPTVIAVTGYTTATNFPLMASFQGSLMGAISAFIMKFGAGGNLMWSTYYGGNIGNQNAEGRGVEVDAAGNIIVAGVTGVTNLPILNPGGGVYFQGPGNGAMSFVSRFNSAGVLTWGTYYGGNGVDQIHDLCKDINGNLYISGYTSSTNFPLQNAAFAAYGGANDAFAVKFNSAGQRLYSTYIGGTGADAGLGIFADNTGNLYLTGRTASVNFPLLNPGGGTYYNGVSGGAGDAFITKLNAAGALLWSTYWGGSASDNGMSVTGSSTGDWYFTGETSSTNLTTLNPGGGAYFQGANAGGVDMFLCRFNSSDALTWSTYFGTTGNNSFNMQYNYGNFLATDNCSNVYLVGEDDAGGLPITNTCNSFTLSYAPTPTQQQSYIVEFNNKNAIVWSSYFYGMYACATFSIKLDGNNNIFTVGEHRMANLPPYAAPAGAYLQSIRTGADDGYLVKFTPTPNKYTQPQVNPSACACNGSATVNVTCGAAPYNYVWSNGSQTLVTSSSTNAITGLCPGNYWVEITDDACSRDTIYYTLTTTTGSLTLSTTQNNVSCNATCNGSTTITASGGTTPYTYSWSSGQTTATITGLCPGSYSIVATDGGGCKSVQSINIIQTPEMVLGFSTQWSCSSNNSSATVNITNGNAPYTYLWSNGQTTQTSTGLTLGSYSITITDSKGCSKVQTANIPQPSSMTLTPTSTNTTCGNSNGSAAVSVSGGTTPYSYIWSNGATVKTNANISSGNYTVTVTDLNGCSKSATYNIAPSSGPTATFTQSPGPSVCVNTPVTFTNTGTTGAGVTYNWLISPPNVSGTTTNFTYTFLNTGSFTVQHTVFSSGCSATISSTVTVTNCATGPSVTATGNSACPGTCTIVTSNGIGGTSPYTYLWSTGATTQNINTCPAATTTYTLTLTDVNGNTATSTAAVIINQPITATMNSTNISCNGNTDGSSIATPAGGTSPYVYTWNNGQTTQTATGLTTGNYTVTITDSKNCSSISTATIISPPALTGQFTKGASNCHACGCKEWLMINATGGTSPYSYSWPDGSINRYKNQLCPGTYTINIKDKNGCNIDVNLSAP
ncbi:MAG: SBBP repeat-containing protein [Bacteroidetes bacterium]|nr:SBBP repeat-containing protein [Bacteroidota bacterium]